MSHGRGGTGTFVAPIPLKPICRRLALHKGLPDLGRGKFLAPTTLLRATIGRKLQYPNHLLVPLFTANGWPPSKVGTFP